MPCPFFGVDGSRCRCGAVEGEVIPTLHEREHFCQTLWQFARCDWYRWARRLSRSITDAEYTAAVFGGTERNLD